MEIRRELQTGTVRAAPDGAHRPAPLRAKREAAATLHTASGASARSIATKAANASAAALNVFFRGGLGSAIGPFVVGYTSDATGSLHIAMSVPVIALVIAGLLAAAGGRLARR